MQQATSIVRQMVTRWGMSEKIGPVALAPEGNPLLGGGEAYFGTSRPYSESTATLIDAEVARILSEYYGDAVGLLREHRATLNVIADALLARETLDEGEMIELTGLRRVPAAVPNGSASGAEAEPLPVSPIELSTT
jgi:cell division protease FtsH